MRATYEFEHLVREHQEQVFRMLVRLLGMREGVEDLAQDVFLRLFRGLKGFRGDAQVRTYLYRIVINVAHDARKRRSREARQLISLTESLVSAESEESLCWEDRLAHPGPDAEASFVRLELAAAVDEALTHLTDAERVALVLYHQEELDYEDIASAMVMPVNTVRTHLHRGRARLRAFLSESRERIRL